MSSNMPSNVVPMPHAATPAPAQSPMPMPAMWGGGGTLPWGPGCCPPGGMDALLKCYCDVQAATAFICQVMVQCIQTNPAVTAAIIAAIEASGSSLPLIGVTNGSDAQPGQVGEWVQFEQPITYTTAPSSQSVTMGILQPGDWDVWAFGQTTTQVSDVQFNLNPIPPGFAQALAAIYAVPPGGAQDYTSVLAGATRASLSVPTLVNFNVQFNQFGAGTAPGSMNLVCCARRMR